LEHCLGQGQGWFIHIDEKVEGYFYIWGDVIFEFHLRSSSIDQRVATLQNILTEFKTNELNCKSFDSALLSTAFFLKPSVSAVGLMFREYDPQVYSPQIKTIPEVQLADKNHIQSIWEVHQDFFDNVAEIEQFIRKEGLYVFTTGNEIVGCGVVSRISNLVDAYDIGMAVNPIFRKQGYGSYIVHTMADFCIRKNQRPVCGCDINNVASYRTLEKAGFRSNHQILRFSF